MLGGTNRDLLTTKKDGTTLILGLNGVEVPDESQVAKYTAQVLRLLQEYPECQVLSFDVTNVQILPSAMLGLLATIRKRGRDVEVHNPSDFIQEALRVTKLSNFVTVTFDKSGDPAISG
jgi:hypothetical protein